MKLEKTDHTLFSEITDRDGDIIKVSLASTDAHLVVGVNKGGLVGLNKGQVEQLIYVLTLARNRMT